MSIQVEVTKEAQSQVRELIKSQKPGTAVRVFLQAGGGCGGGDACGCGAGASSGPSFGMSFDRPRNGDEVVKVDGFALVVDASTASQLDGARIDYVQELEQTGFKIVSPQQGEPTAPIGSGCGCGAGGGGCC
ncbi:MAG: iron-sulfur cluster assembly accessory protein [Thermoplasmata archaeon]